MIWKAVTVVLWLKQPRPRFCRLKKSASHYGRVYFTPVLAAMPGFRATALTQLALIEAEILFCHPERSRRAKKIGAQSRTNDNYCTATALQIKPE